MGSQFSAGVFHEDIEELTGLDFAKIVNLFNSTQKCVSAKPFLTVHDLQSILSNERQKGLRVFKIFDLHKKNKVSALEFWGSLCLSCCGMTTEKVSFLFALANDGERRMINKIELVIVFFSAARGLSRLKSTIAPPMKLISKLVTDCFEFWGKIESTGGMKEIDYDRIMKFCERDKRVCHYLANLDSSASTLICELYQEQAMILKRLALVDATLDKFEKRKTHGDCYVKMDEKISQPNVVSTKVYRLLISQYYTLLYHIYMCKLKIYSNSL